MLGSVMGGLKGLTGGMSSLTAGGGFAPSSSASAHTGDQTTGAFNVGGMTFGGSSGQNDQLIILGAVALLGLLVWKR